MDLENKNREDIIKPLKKAYKLEPMRGLDLNLRSFGISKTGELFKHLYSWKILSFQHDAYITSLRNSYVTEVINSNYTFETKNISGRYLGILIETAQPIPDFTIRPSFLADKISNLILRYDIKIEGFPKFNKNYILSSEAPLSAFEKILTRHFLTKVEGLQNFYLEMKDSRIFMKFENEMSSSNAIELMAIGELIDKNIKNST